MKTRKIITAFLAMLMLLSVLGVPAFADGDGDTKPIISSNIGANDYENWNRWADNVKSYMFDSGDGTFTRVEYTNENGVFVELYKDNVFQWRKDISLELPIWGGFFAGAQYNFFVFGQENQSENNNAEVVRIVRYTKDWKRVDKLSVYGANTTIPFDAGSLRMAENGGTLYIHSCHLMYYYEGKRHQATMWFDVDTSSNSMTLLRSGCEFSDYTHDYVSHSFNQFVVTDGNYVVKMDHGDASPRSVTMCRKPLDGSYIERVTVMPIAGEFGDNDTGVALGGFEVTSSSYILAGNAVSMGEDYDPYGARNIFLSVIDKENLSVYGGYLTNFKTEGVVVSNPRLVKIDGDNLLLMWNEGTSTGYKRLNYLIIDCKGQVKSALYYGNAYLSDCQPIVMNNKVTWYVTNGQSMRLYSIDIGSMELSVQDLADGGTNPIHDGITPKQVYEGAEVALSLSVKDGEPTFQWQYSADEGATWKDFPAYERRGDADVSTGSTTDTLVFMAKMEYNNNIFRCRITFDGEKPHDYIIVRLVVIPKDQPDPPPAVPLLGDLNGDGQVDNADLVTLARAIVGIVKLTDTQTTAADMNKDGMVDNQDLVLLARQLVGA